MRKLIFCLALAATVALPPTAFGQQEPEEFIDLGCDPGFGTLRTLYRQDIEAIDDGYSFSFWPVCTGVWDPGVILKGNAGGLHSLIARNAAFAAALDADGWEAEDVVGIRFGANNSVIVYVYDGD